MNDVGGTNWNLKSANQTQGSSVIIAETKKLPKNYDLAKKGAKASKTVSIWFFICFW